MIVKTRTKPIISMLEDIRVYIMKRWATNKSKVKSFKGAVYPRIVDRLKKESSLTRHWIPRYVINIYIYVSNTIILGVYTSVVLHADGQLRICLK